MVCPGLPGVVTAGSRATQPEAWWHGTTWNPLEFASMRRLEGTVAETVAQMFDPSTTMADLACLLSVWEGSLVVKGVQTVDDARSVVAAGADAVVVSNHGGRQLDRAPAPLEVLPRVVDIDGERAEVFVDGGILSGADVVVAVASGERGAGRSVSMA